MLNPGSSVSTKSVNQAINLAQPAAANNRINGQNVSLRQYSRQNSSNSKRVINVQNNAHQASV